LSKAGGGKGSSGCFEGACWQKFTKRGSKETWCTRGAQTKRDIYRQVRGGVGSVGGGGCRFCFKGEQKGGEKKTFARDPPQQKVSFGFTKVNCE